MKTGISRFLRNAAAALLVVCAAAAVPAGGADAGEFFASVEDLPLPAGFVELEGDAMVFESPAGRIVTTVARGTGSVESVRAFYGKVLPPLGWERRAVDRYQRDSEELTFAFEPAGPMLVFRVRIVPENAK
ncbi:MAG: hypothetical protein WD470_08810 [Rhodospirillaceae bacterium]